MPSMNPEWVLIDELLKLTRYWNAYDLVGKEDQKRITEIGRELDKMGGYDLMLYAYRTVKSANRYVTAIQAYWDGIGAWKW